MLEERGVAVDYTTIFGWIQRYAPEIEWRLRWYWRRALAGREPGASARPLRRPATHSLDRVHHLVVDAISP